MLNQESNALQGTTQLMLPLLIAVATLYMYLASVIPFQTPSERKRRLLVDVDPQNSRTVNAFAHEKAAVAPSLSASRHATDLPADCLAACRVSVKDHCAVLVRKQARRLPTCHSVAVVVILDLRLSQTQPDKLSTVDQTSTD